jgi:hypothetical protein
MARKEDGGGNRRMNQKGWEPGEDAAYIKPKMIPDMELLPRDDSGGPDWMGYSQQFGDGDFKIGEKAHLSARGGSDDEEEGDEVSEMPRGRAAMRAGGEKVASPKVPGRLSKEGRE